MRPFWLLAAIADPMRGSAFADGVPQADAAGYHGLVSRPASLVQ